MSMIAFVCLFYVVILHLLFGFLRAPDPHSRHCLPEILDLWMRCARCMSVLEARKIVGQIPFVPGASCKYFHRAELG
jgi:hypothetical protein